MSTGATATFTIDSWDQEPYDESDGVSLARARVTETFTGDLDGTSVGNLLLVGAQDGSAAYVGIERVTGELQGRRGTFVLQHAVVMTSAGGGSMTLTVVPDSGTGGLRHLIGTAQIDRHEDGSHTFSMDYELADR